MKPYPKNEKLYKEIIKNAQQKFKKWPSAYASAWVVKEYKKSGKYIGNKSSKTGITRWFDEKWINVCKLPKKVSCGRPKLSISNWKKKYPYCRPSKKINSKPPIIASKISKSELKRRCNLKYKSPLKRVIIKKIKSKKIKSKKIKKSKSK